MGVIAYVTVPGAFPALTGVSCVLPVMPVTVPVMLVVEEKVVFVKDVGVKLRGVPLQIAMEAGKFETCGVGLIEI